MKIIPALDIMDGKCVRLTQGDFEKRTEYDPTPVEMAQYFAECEADMIHVVDLDGARAKRLVNVSTIAEICAATDVGVQVGGGIRTAEDLRRLFELGVSRVVIGSLAVVDGELVRTFVRTFGAERVVVGVDSLDGRPRISGWREKTELTDAEVLRTLVDIGITTVIYTDILRDGMMGSPNFSRYEELILDFPDLKFVASGGVSSVEDVDGLRKTGVEGVIIGKAIYEVGLLGDLGKLGLLR